MVLPVRVDKSEPYDIFIGRPSKFSNPYEMGIDGTRSEVIQKFEKYFRNHPQLEALIEELDGKRISCWCSIDQNCHGDSIISIIKERNKLLILNDLFE
jgi:Domain of unknown function (DUF4326)